MGLMDNLLHKEKSISEIEEDNERLEAENRHKELELSITQKRVMIAKLKERGLQPKHFGFDFQKIAAWLKSH